MKKGNKVKVNYNRSGIPSDEVGEITWVYLSGYVDVKLPSLDKDVLVHRSNVTLQETIDKI